MPCSLNVDFTAWVSRRVTAIQILVKYFASRQNLMLLNRYRLGQIAWLVYIATASDCDVISEQL